jgi:hypothetical protein
MEAMSCARQVSGLELTARDTVHFYASVFNLKLAVCKEFSDILNISRYDVLTSNMFPVRKRVKRWFFTGGLSALTGLADSSTVEKLSKDAHKILVREQQDAVQIANLDNKANEILGSLKDQNDKVARLYEDESRLNFDLKNVLADEQEITRRIDEFMAALESLTDVEIEYSSLASTFVGIEMLVEDLERQIYSMISQSVTVDMLPRDFGQINKFKAGAILFARISGKVDAGGHKLVYRLPEVLEIYDLSRVTVLPISLQRNLWGRFQLESKSIAKNRKGYSFLFNEEDCTRSGDNLVCFAERLEIHRRPQSCVEELVVNQGFSGICVRKMDLIIPSGQQYIHHTDVNVVTLFSAFNDTMEIVCGARNGSVSSISQIGIGYTIVHLPWGCKILTTELVVYSAATVEVEGSIPLVTAKDWSVEIGKLAEDIGEIHRLNLSRLESDFTQYAESVRVSKMDIAEVEDSIRSFKRIERLTRYNPVNIDWEEPTSVSNVMTAVGAVVILIVVIVPIVICCRCCSCCTSVLEFLWRLVTGTEGASGGQ